MTPAVVAAAGAATLGPLTLVLAHSTMRSSWNPTRTEVVAVTTLGGLTALLATHWPWAAPAALPLAIAGPAAAIVDVREGRLPDALTGPLCASTALITALAVPDGGRSFVGAAAVAIGAVIVAIVARSALGWGDVKLLPTVALVLSGCDALGAGLLTVAVLSMLTTTFIWARDRHALVPYGPALVVGTLGTIGL